MELINRGNFLMERGTSKGYFHTKKRMRRNSKPNPNQRYRVACPNGNTNNRLSVTYVENIEKSYIRFILEIY